MKFKVDDLIIVREPHWSLPADGRVGKVVDVNNNQFKYLAPSPVSILNNKDGTQRLLYFDPELVEKL